MSWALLRAQQACRAHVARAASAGRAHAERALVATRPGSLPPGRDLTLMSRPQGSQNHVATSNRCRDTSQTTPCRDITSVSRHRFSCPHRCPCRDIKPGLATAAHVATSYSCRDIKPTQPKQTRSRLHFLVATSACRDLQTRSRPSAGNWQ